MEANKDDIHAFHIVLTTHNSRISKRMLKLGIRKGEAVTLELSEEIELTKIIGNIVTESSYRCVAFNICNDHVHMILGTSVENLSSEIQKIKAVSSKLIKPFLSSIKGTTGQKVNHKKARAYVPFWSQKFYRVDLNVWSLGSFSYKPGYVYSDNHLSNAIFYVNENRVKHKLEKSKELEYIIDGFILDLDSAFGIS